MNLGVATSSPERSRG